MKQRELETCCILNELGTGRLSRRQALKALLAMGFVSALAGRMIDGALADEAGKQTGPGGLPLARPDKPVTLPLYEDPIKGGLDPETGGTFKLFNYAEYIDTKLVDAFGEKYGVAMEINTFDDMDQAITRLATRAVQPDVTNITTQRIAQAVAGKLAKPLNLDYIPNLKKNVWPSLHSPYYDTDSHYTVPYTVYGTGIGWRAEKISEDISKLDNPWSIFWNAQNYKGHVGVLDDTRESLVMAMLYRGQHDVNTEDPAEIEKALADLKALTPICNPKVAHAVYESLGKGTSWLHHTWSGDLLNAYLAFLPENDDGSTLRYWGAKGKSPIQNDAWAICSTTTKPVLSHLWLNYLLDADVAYKNFVEFNGYQPPQVAITADSLIAKKAIPENLRNTIYTSEDAGPGTIQEGTLTVQGLALWQNAYARFVSGG